MKSSFSVSPGEIADHFRDNHPTEHQYIPARTRIGRSIHLEEQQRHVGWESELYLKFTYYSVRNDCLLITGRADLVQRSQELTRLIELKSIALTPSQFASLTQPPTSFLIQTKVYAYLFHKAFDTPTDLISAELRCINISDNESLDWQVEWSAVEVEALLEDQIALLRKAKAHRLRELRRRKSLARRISFPFENVRPVQQIIIETVEKAFEEGGDALIEAPPGSGKTLAVLTPSLRASLANGSQLFFATAKSGGRNPPRKAVEQLITSLSRLRVVFLASHEEICGTTKEHSLCKFCRQDSPIEGSYLPDEIPELKNGGIFDTTTFVKLADEYGCCATALAHAAAAQADLLVGDYNFLFDPGARLEQFQRDEPLNWYLAGDEAHNLSERSRENWSAEVNLKELNRQWSIVNDDLWRFNDFPATEVLRSAFENLRKQLDNELSRGEPGMPVEAEFSPGTTEKLYEELAINAGYVHAGAGERFDPEARDSLNRLLGTLGHFARIVQLERGRYLHYVDFDSNSIGIKCLDPSVELADVFNRLRGFVLFSGTLGPIDQFREEIGEPNRPFAEIQARKELIDDERLVVLRASGIDTRRRSRNLTARKVAQTIEKFSSLSPGAILAVFPSYEYLDKISTILDATKFNVVAQRPDMAPLDRREFRQKLTGVSGRTIGLVVAGGQFSEAEDYQGEACVGVVIVGPCLPPTDPWREALAAYWYDKGVDGGSVAFVIPALRRVVQAAGRMLRRDDDRGIVLLIDDRFGRDPIFSLLPQQWQTKIQQQQGSWEALAREFWTKRKELDDG